MASEPNVQDGRLALVLNNVLINVDLPRPDDPKCKIKVDIKLKIHNQASTLVLIYSLCYKSNKNLHTAKFLSKMILHIGEGRLCLFIDT